MTKYTVTLQVPSLETYVYEVEANDNENALALVMDEHESAKLVLRELEEESSFGDIQMEVEEHEED